MVEDTMFSGESKNIEYKVSLPDKSEKYMKTIVAFANTQGGKLIVGVDDKTHQIVGVENEVLFQLMDGIANIFTQMGLVEAWGSGIKSQATTNLKELLDKRDAIRKEEILSAVVKSERSYEDIL